MEEKAIKEKSSHPAWSYFRLPPFSPVAIQIVQLVNQEDVAVDELSKLISSDQALASTVLTLANSALYSHRFPVVDILHAINRIGIKNIQGLCLNAAMVGFLGKSLKLPTMRTLWSHNLACGFIAEMLATGTGIDQGSAFTCGLMHDVGRLALAVLRPNEYMLLLEKHAGSPASILQCETEMFGFDHCEAGHELVLSWALPTPFDAVVSTHHGQRQKDNLWDLAGLINLSCRMADCAGFAAFSLCEATSYTDLLEELPKKAVRSLYPDVESLALEIRGRIEMMQAV
jgi:HD-like signal output (HDOD) protein